jgi:hypothetical protein
MAKSLLYRLFGLGKLPKQLRATFESEGILLLDEGVPSSLTYLDFRAPGKRFAWKRQWFTASLVMTQSRIVALQYSNFAINVPFADERVQKMRFSVEGESTLLVEFDAGLFHEKWSGRIEYRFKTPQGQVILRMLKEREVLAPLPVLGSDETT